MSDLVGNHIVGFPTWWLIYYCQPLHMHSHYYFFGDDKCYKLLSKLPLKTDVKPIKYMYLEPYICKV